jgi:hypothetical protein
MCMNIVNAHWIWIFASLYISYLILLKGCTYTYKNTLRFFQNCFVYSEESSLVKKWVVMCPILVCVSSEKILTILESSANKHHPICNNLVILLQSSWDKIIYFFQNNILVNFWGFTTDKILTIMIIVLQIVIIIIIQLLKSNIVTIYNKSNFFWKKWCFFYAGTELLSLYSKITPKNQA